MKEYYIHDGKDQVGPLRLEEVLKLSIHGDTPVWHADLDTWTPAKNIEELKSLFAQKVPPPFVAVTTTPPPFSAAQILQPVPVKKKSMARNPLKSLLFLTVIAGIVFIIFIIVIKNRPGTYASTTYTESKISVGDYERSHPAEFLESTGTYNRTFWGNKIKLHGSITNKATVTNFKDITIQVRYYSATKSLIDRESFVLYDYVSAHSKKTLEWKIKPPRGTETIDWDVLDATPY